MAFYFSKEEKEKRKNEKEKSQQLREQLKLEEENYEKEYQQEFLKEMNEYCDWYFYKTEEFKKELITKNFIATMGFETEEVIDLKYGIGSRQIDGVTVFDIPKLTGIAFDNKSRRIIYYVCRGNYYENYKNFTNPIYEYDIIKFEELFKVKIEINSRTINEKVSNKDIIKRSLIGGTLAGEAGAIIGGTTAQVKNEPYTVPKNIVFTIQTTNDTNKIISFEFDKSNYNPNSEVASYTSIADAMNSTFSGKKNIMEFREENTTRKCGTSTDYIYERDSDDKIANLEIIVDRLKDYAMQIETIIQENKKTNKVDKVSSVADEITKLISLKNSDAITDEEFEFLKSRIIQN